MEIGKEQPAKTVTLPARTAPAKQPERKPLRRTEPAKTPERTPVKTPEKTPAAPREGVPA